MNEWVSESSATTVRSLVIRLWWKSVGSINIIPDYGNWGKFILENLLPISGDLIRTGRVDRVYVCGGVSICKWSR